MVLTILRNAMILWVFLAGSVAAQVTPERMLQSLIAANEQDWDTATRLAPDVLTLDLVTWMRLRSGADSFEDYQAFTTTRFDWPGMDRVFARGEESIPEGYSAGQVIGWLGDRLPQTGVGAVRLAQAYGPGLKALDVLEKTWVHQRLDKDGHDVMVAEFGDLIAPFHMRRVEELLWRSRRTEADWMLPLLTDDQRALVEARLAYGRNSGDLVEKLEAVPDPLKDDAGLAYDRYNWLSDRGSKAQAVDLLLERSTSVAALGEPFRWSGWRRSLARSEMRAGRSDRAYQVASKHFLTEGSSFADRGGGHADLDRADGLLVRARARGFGQCRCGASGLRAGGRTHDGVLRLAGGGKAGHVAGSDADGARRSDRVARRTCDGDRVGARGLRIARGGRAVIGGVVLSGIGPDAGRGWRRKGRHAFGRNG